VAIKSTNVMLRVGEAERQVAAGRMWSGSWPWVDDDPSALSELRRRLIACGHQPDRLLTYGQAVAGLTFRLPTVDDGRPFQLGGWREIDRAVLGMFLGRLSAETIRDCTPPFMLSALTFGEEGNRPSAGGFFGWARDVGLPVGTGRDAEDRFWFDNIEVARAWCAKQPPELLTGERRSSRRR
jgi:hypothetical protein